MFSFSLPTSNYFLFHLLLFPLVSFSLNNFHHSHLSSIRLAFNFPRNCTYCSYWYFPHLVYPYFNLTSSFYQLPSTDSYFKLHIIPPHTLSISNFLLALFFQFLTCHPRHIDIISHYPFLHPLPTIPFTSTCNSHCSPLYRHHPPPPANFSYLILDTISSPAPS